MDAADPKNCDPKISIELALRLPGDTMRVELTCFFPGTIPSAFILNEPREATPAWTRLRDQVELLNALRKMARPKFLTLIVEADRSCHDILLPAHSLMTRDGARAEAAA